MKSLPSRGLPTRTVVVVVCCIAVLAAIPIVRFLRIGFGTTGSSIAPEGAATPPPAIAAVLDTLRRRVAENPRDVQSLEMLAGLYAQAGKTDRALDYARRAVDAAPNDADALYTHGILAVRVSAERTRGRTELRRFLRLAQPHDARRTAATAALEETR